MFGKRLATICLALYATSFASRAAIDFSEAGQHVGKQVTISGKVSRVNTIASGLTFINFGSGGESAGFTVVARPGLGDAGTFKVYQGQIVEVTGTVELYRDSPQISLKSVDSISLSGKAPDTNLEDREIKKPSQAKFEIRKFAVDLEKKEQREAGETSSGVEPTKSNAAIAIPKDFKPSENQRILAVFPDFSSDADVEKLLTPYANIAISKGWILLTARGPSLDFDLAPAWHTVMFHAAISKLSEEYPGITDWSFYLAGNADGASRATLSTGAMMKEGYDVKGVYVGSLKFESMTRSVQEFDPSSLKFKKIKVFVSYAKEDNMIFEADSKEQAELIRKTGIKEIRHETHNGRSGVDSDSLKKALEWFEETE